MIIDSTVTQESLDSVKERLNKRYFKTKFSFLSGHDGLRPGELHSVIAPKGGGKSTFVKTLLCESLQNQKKTYCYLSEEDPELYRLPIVEAFVEAMKQSGSHAPLQKANCFLSKLLVESELSLERNRKTLDNFFDYLENTIIEHGIEVIFLDNFTTSFLGCLSVNEQGLAVMMLKKLAVKHNIPIILILHTAKGTDIYKQILDGDNVRGNATASNMGSYNYLVITFFRCNPVRVFVIIDKARYHNRSNKQVYELFYDKEIGLFILDQKSSYEEVQKVINEVNKPKKRGF